jgi:2'-5' RNA ligase
MTEDRKITYAIALLLSNQTADKLSKLRTGYQEATGYIVNPHITLVYPFSPVFSLFQVNEQLDKVARRHKQFNVILNHIAFFEDGKNVVYAALHNNRTVKSLHMDIFRSLEGLIQEWNIEADYNLERYVPHVTIGAKIPDSIFPDIKKKYSSYSIHCEDTITRFILFSDIDGTWERKRVYELKGAAADRGRTVN